MSFAEFRAKILKIHGGNKHKITGSYGITDAYRQYYSKKYPKPVSASLYSSIVIDMHNLMIDSFLEGNDIDLPQKMGYIQLVKMLNRRNNMVDWYRTLQLWYSDEESKKNKTIVRREDKECFNIEHINKKRHYPNKTYMMFRAARGFKDRLKQKIRDNEIDAFVRGYGK